MNDKQVVCGSSTMDDKTVVLGVFNEEDIVFTIGDCKRVDKCIKVHNIHSSNDPNAKFPSVLDLSDSRLVLQKISKKTICNFFNIGLAAKPQSARVKQREKGKANVKRGTFAIAH